MVSAGAEGDLEPYSVSGAPGQREFISGHQTHFSFLSCFTGTSHSSWDEDDYPSEEACFPRVCLGRGAPGAGSDFRKE